jgi:putative sterol carrier protein
MAELTEVLFHTLAQRGHEPSLASVSGTVRFDLRDGERTEHWYLTIDRGDVSVEHKQDDADCVLRADLATFEAIVAGRTNAMAALLRGAIEIEGRALLMIMLQRLFPGPAAPNAERRQAGYARRQS